jgi:hypothetical protein
MELYVAARHFGQDPALYGPIEMNNPLTSQVTGAFREAADAVGKIDVFPTRSYVAIRRADAAKALERLRAGKIKGRNVRVARL